jgi:hypothetical protein
MIRYHKTNAFIGHPFRQGNIFKRHTGYSTKENQTKPILGTHQLPHEHMCDHKNVSMNRAATPREF